MNQLLQTLENSVNLVLKILPVSHISVELNRFSFARMENPEIHGYDHSGPLHGFLSVEDAVSEQQGGHCMFCRKAIWETHHIVPRSKGGSHTVANCVGLCEKHHDLIHKETEWFDKMVDRKAGLEKKYHALSALNQAIPFFWEWLKKLEPFIHVSATMGWKTKQLREKLGLPKDHHIDAWCIAAAALDEEPTEAPALPEPYQVMQFRRHDRKIANYTTSRTYWLGEEKVATNRRKATMAVPKVKKNGKVFIEEKQQSVDSLEEYRAKLIKQYGEKEAGRIISRLNVQKSRRVYNNMDRLLPGLVFTTGSKRKGTLERHVLRGNHSGGKAYIVAQYGVTALKAEASITGKKARKALKDGETEEASRLEALAAELKNRIPKDKEYQVPSCRAGRQNSGLVYVTETF